MRSTKSRPRAVGLASIALAVQTAVVVLWLARAAPLIAAPIAVAGLALVVALRAGNPLACHGGLLFSVVATVTVWALSGDPRALVPCAAALGVYVACVVGRDARAHFGLVCPSCRSTHVVGEDFLHRRAKCRSCGARWSLASPADFQRGTAARVPAARKAFAPPPARVVVAAVAIAAEGLVLAGILVAAVPLFALACAGVGVACAMGLVRGRPFALQAAGLLAFVGVVIMAPLLSFGKGAPDAWWFGFVAAPALLLVFPMQWSRAARAHFNLVCPACRSLRVGSCDLWFREARCRSCAATWRTAESRPGTEVFD